MEKQFDATALMSRNFSGPFILTDKQKKKFTEMIQLILDNDKFAITDYTGRIYNIYVKDSWKEIFTVEKHCDTKMCYKDLPNITATNWEWKCLHSVMKDMFPIYGIKEM